MVFLNTLLILCLSDRVISFTRKQDRKSCYVCRVIFHSGLSSWLEWTRYNLFCGVKCIAKEKGNDNQGNMFGYRPVSYKLGSTVLSLLQEV